MTNLLKIKKAETNCKALEQKQKDAYAAALGWALFSGFAFGLSAYNLDNGEIIVPAIDFAFAMAGSAFMYKNCKKCVKAGNKLYESDKKLSRLLAAESIENKNDLER